MSRYSSDPTRGYPTGQLEDALRSADKYGQLEVFRDGHVVAFRTGAARGWKAFNLDAMQEEAVTIDDYNSRSGRLPNPKKRYSISTQDGPKDVEGSTVGRFLAVHVEERFHSHNKTKKVYCLDHLPSGFKIRQYDMLKTAKMVAQKLNETYGELLAEREPARLVEHMKDQDPEVVAWMLQEHPGDFEQFKAAANQQGMIAQALRRLKEQFEGKWYHWVEGKNYGKEGKILKIERSLPDGFVATVQWTAGHASHGFTVGIGDIRPGYAPDDMPWKNITEYHGPSFEIARIDSKRFVISSFGLHKYYLWTEGLSIGEGGISQHNPKEFSTIEAAEAFAKKYAHELPRSTEPMENPTVVAGSLIDREEIDPSSHYTVWVFTGKKWEADRNFKGRYIIEKLYDSIRNAGNVAVFPLGFNPNGESRYVAKKNPEFEAYIPLDYGQLPSRKLFVAAVEDDMPFYATLRGQDARVIDDAGYSSDLSINDPDELYDLLEKLVAFFEEGDEEAGDLASGILYSCGWEWI